MFSLRTDGHFLFTLFGGVALACIAIYARSLGNEFVGWDDGLLITENAWVHGLTWANVKHVFTNYDPELYVPLSLLSYQVNYAVGGLDPFGYHLVNLILHILNASLVGVLALTLSKNRWCAVFCALAFAVHPLNTEAVAWASGRKDVLSAFFCLCSLLGYLRWRASKDKRWLLVSVTCFALGLLSKVNTILLPMLLLLLAWREHGTVTKKDWMAAIPYAVLSVIFGIIAAFGKLANTGFLWDKFLMACKAVAFYLGKLVLPTDLSVLYPYTKPISILTPNLAWSVLVVLAITALTVRLWLKRGLREPLFAWAFFLILLIPSFSNVTKGHNELLDVYFGSDRYAYLPSIGVFFLAGLGMAWLARQEWRAAAGIIACAVTPLSVGAYVQSMTWKDSWTMFSHVAEARPNAYVAYTNLGTLLVQDGKIDEGLAQYRKALTIRDDATTLYNVGQILAYQGDTEGAITSYRKAVASSPLEKDAWMQLGALLGERGDKEDALKALKEALALDPEDEDLRLTIEEYE